MSCSYVCSCYGPSISLVPDSSTLYLTPTQQEMVVKRRDEEAKLLEARRDPTQVHKYNAAAYVDSAIVVMFYDRQPCKARYMDVDLGPLSFQPSCVGRDVPYRIHNREAFRTYLIRHPTFYLRISQNGGQARVCDEHGVPIEVETVDFTDPHWEPSTL